MKQKTVKLLSALLALVLAVSMLPMGAGASRTLAEVQKEIAAKKEEMKQLEANILANENNIAVATVQLGEYQVKYDELVALIDEQEALIELTRADLNTKLDQLSDTRERIIGNQKLAIERLRAIYKANSTNVMISTLLAVDSFADYAQVSDSMLRVSQRDKELLLEMSAQQAQYERQRLDIEANLERLDGELVELEQNRADCNAMIEELKARIAWANLQIAQSQEAHRQSKEDLEALQAEQNRIFQESQNRGSKYGDGSIRYDGDLKWPVPGRYRISSYYGVYRSNTGSHYGIDIPGPTGTPIVASAPGLVITAEWHWSYGNYIIIDHNDGMRTLYAHCDELWVGAGAWVELGDAIAAMGNTGNSYGAHLHFELHDRGSRQNPLDYGYLPEP